MKDLIESVLLIQGNPKTARQNEMIIENTNLVYQIAVAYNADNALNYIRQRLSVGKTLPSIILIDIYLPESSVWGILDKIQSSFIDKEFPEIYLLGYDSNAQEIIKGSVHPLTKGIINLPLMDWEITKILNKYKQQLAYNVA